MSSSRDAILNRLRQHDVVPGEFEGRGYVSRFDWDQEEKIRRLTERMEAVRAEIHRCGDRDWVEVVAEVCREKSLSNLVASPVTDAGKKLWAAADELPQLQDYSDPIEDWKNALFNDIGVGFTTTLGGIAETGTLMLWPNVDEPRLLSLVPPVHIALLQASRLHSTFAEAIEENGWATTGMPTNALLISGPSKSADIEQTLAYGVHGPRELVVIIVED